MSVSESGLNVFVSAKGSTVTLSFSGDIDATTAGVFAESILASVEAGQCTVIIDLRAVSFMDSTGINALVQAKRLAHRRLADLCIDGLSDNVRRVLELAGVDRLLLDGATFMSNN